MRDLHLLAVDDDELVLAALRMNLPPAWRLIEHDCPTSLPDGPFHAALIDMHLSSNRRDPAGLEVIRQLRARDPHLEVVAMSGDLDRQLMEQALKAGASRFLAKPIQREELELTLNKIEEWWLLQGALLRQGRKVRSWLGQSPAAREVQRKIAALKGEAGPILISGESGTGKEVVAELLHAQRPGAPWVTINVAGIPENLFESEIFGHVRGAFTGAETNKMGLAEAAHGGDFFLDEIEALPLSQQAKLLRFLESGEIRRVGAKENLRVDCRVIAATNRPLKDLVKEGRFREDLLWRLSGKSLELPPLRDRTSDVGLLMQYFLDSDSGRKKKIETDAIEALESYSWPGNVRELKRVAEQLLVQAPLPVIRALDVRGLIRPNSSPLPEKGFDFSSGLTEMINQFEAEAIRHCLELHRDIDEAARTLQISRSNLYKKIKDHHIQWRDS